MTYSFMDDFAAGYALACRMLALRHGSVRPANGWEWYWLEAQGLVP
jgi:hypothetical protein